MIVAVVLGVAVLGAFAWYAPRLVRGVPPRTATYLLVGGAVASTGAAAGMLGLLAATAVAQLPPVAAAGEWSRPALHDTDPVPIWLAICSATALVPAACLGLLHTRERTRAFIRLHRDCRDLGPSVQLGETANVVVVDSEFPEAFATPAGGGRIVVTQGLLRALTRDEQRVLLAHEAAHLRYRHAWWVLVAQLCAAVNPTLRGVARATAHAVERWADEVAADTVGDRRLAARAVARAALHVNQAHRRGNPVTVSIVDGAVPQRVRALLAPPPRAHHGATAVLVLLLASSIACATDVQRRTDAFFDLASQPCVTASDAPNLSR